MLLLKPLDLTGGSHISHARRFVYNEPATASHQ